MLNIKKNDRIDFKLIRNKLIYKLYFYIKLEKLAFDFLFDKNEKSYLCFMLICYNVNMLGVLKAFIIELYRAKMLRLF